MKKILMILFITISALMLVSCSSEESSDKLRVVSSFTIITDMVEQIGKDHVVTHNLVPSGTDPHEYEPLPNDVKHASDADLLLYNGLNLEGGKNGWFFKLIKSVKQDMDNVYNIGDTIEELYISDQNNNEQVNPHAFVSPKNGIIMAKNILKALKEKDPINESYYQENANNYISLLESIDREYDEKFLSVDEDKRIIVTSERAFQYLASDYNISEGYIWAIDTDESGSAEQIRNVVEFINNNDVRYLFLESNVDTRPMQTVSHQTGVPIYPIRVYADEIGVKGSIVDSYEKFLRHNLDVFYKGLTTNMEGK